MHQLR